jgi:integrase
VLGFGYFTGCRRAEVLGLQWPRVDLVSRIVRLEPGETKNSEGREIPIVAELYDMLAIQRERRDRLFPDCPWVFFGETGEQIRVFRDAWETACKAAGLVDSAGEAALLFHTCEEAV